MNFITHSLLPVVIKQTAELKSEQQGSYSTQWKHWIAIAVFGTLPDLLDFHMTVAERWSSFSHQWPMTTSIFLFCWLCYLLFPKQALAKIAPWCGLAYVLHIPCDLISGGLDFFNTGHVHGDWWISFLAWPFIDAFFIAWFILNNRTTRRRYGLIPSVIKEWKDKYEARRISRH
jgi:hypothetical protein